MISYPPLAGSHVESGSLQSQITAMWCAGCDSNLRGPWH